MMTPVSQYNEGVKVRKERSMAEKMITLKGEIAEELEALAQARGRSIEAFLREMLSMKQKGSGWPPNYFETLDAIQSDDMIERPDQGEFEEREQLL